MGTPMAVAVALSLPDDIITDILARLPARSVLRCRCLSRAWAATLSSDHFADRHRRLANHRNSPRVFFLHYSFGDGPRVLMHTWSHSHQGCPNGAPWRMDDAISSCGTGHDHNKQAATIRIAALECHGLVLLEAFRKEINYLYLCNPSTRQVTALPQGHKKLSMNSWVDGHYACLGLGYDVHKKQHKVVRIYYHGRWACNHEGHPRSAGCEVYAVGATGRQRWQPIQQKPPGWARPNHPSAFVQGHVYWLAKRNFTNTPMDMVIMSFSLADNDFGTVPPPIGMDSERLSKHQLTKLDDHLCLFSHVISHGSHYDIWLLAQHDERRWNFHCRIDMSKVSPGITGRYMNCWLNPLAIINNGNHILFERPRLAHTDNYSRLCAYDPVTGDVEDVFSGNNMVYSYMVGLETAVYQESIVFPG